MTGAHKTLPLPSYVKVRNLKNRKEIIIRLNDRGPFLKDRIIDLSYAAANKLNIIEKGSELVEVELIDPTKFTNSKVSNGKFIQAGAFKSYSNGELLLKKLEQLNFLNNLDLKVIQIDNLYHVLIGPFDDDRLIELTKDKLKNEYELTTYIKNYGR
jgi:rare lipoprotein A